MIRQTAALFVALNAILFLLGILWLPVLLVAQGFVSVVVLGVLYFWISQLDEDLDKKRDQ